MVRQTPIDRGRAPQVRRSLSGLAHDAITLAELQCQLFAVDLQEARRGGVRALVELGAGAILGLGCLPVLLLAGAQALIEVLQWPTYAAYGLVGITTLAVAVCLSWIGWRQFVRSLSTVERSQREFMETLRWLKDSLRPSETTAEFDADEWRNQT